jgi:hypothetical protein
MNVTPRFGQVYVLGSTSAAAAERALDQRGLSGYLDYMSRLTKDPVFDGKKPQAYDKNVSSLDLVDGQVLLVTNTKHKDRNALAALLEAKKRELQVAALPSTAYQDVAKAFMDSRKRRLETFG